MSFKQVTVSNGGTSAGFDPVLTVPSQTLEGDRLTVVVQTSDNAPDITPTPPGWTLEASGSMPIDGTAAVSPSAVWIYGKDASAADESGAGSDTYTWTFSGSEEQCGWMVLTDPATFGEFAKNELTGNRTTIDAPTVTTTVVDELVFHCALKDGGVAFTSTPAGTLFMDETFGATSGAGAAARGVYAEFGIGGTGVKAFTHASEESNGYTFSLVPVSLVSYEQEGHQFRQDDGSEVAATDIGAQDSNITAAKQINRRLRVLVDTIDGDPPSEGVTLEYRKVGDGTTEWRPVPLT